MATIRVAQLTDPHVGSTTANQWHNRFLSDRPEETLAAAVAAVNALRPDLVVVTGDLADTAAEQELATARAVLDALEAPWIVCRGNHDVTPAGDRAPFDRAFGDRAPVGVVPPHVWPLPEDTLAVTFDAAWAERDGQWRVFLPQAQLAAVLDALDAARPERLLVLCHFPFVRQSEHVRAMAADGRNAGTLWDGEAALAALAARAGFTLALTGHQHFHHIASDGGWLHVTTASLAEYPAELRLVTLADGLVGVQTAPAAPAVVAASPPAVTWVRGRPEDREVVIQR